uniref:BLUF domain-containing protein n=1 Tax=Roseihalotalea indica TaxID=2867963 RepID=A0AA49GSF0_9BACT|nr:BLUF domain-containing protein [Tunicatimonas sp. TK19036]
MLSQLVYVSSRSEFCTDQEIQKILASCQKNNKDKDITGVLLYSLTHFVQYLEGEYSEIIHLYDKIKEDQRHKKAVMISNGPISGRVFPSWQMGAKKFDNYAIDYQSDMNGHEQETFRNILAGKNSNNAHTIAIMKKFFK